MWAMTAKGKNGNNGTTDTTDYQSTTGEHSNRKTTLLQRSPTDVSRTESGH